MESEALESILLQGQYPLHPKSQPIYQVLVTANKITCLPCDIRVTTAEQLNSVELTSVKSRGKAKVLHFDDIIGCECQKGDQQKNNDNERSLQNKAAYMCIYSYPRHHQFLSKVAIRKRITLVVTFNKLETFGENFAEALRWNQVITCLIANRGHISAMPQDVNAWSFTDKRKFIVLVNPASGPGKAAELFRHKVQPMFAEASLQHQVIVTKRAGEGMEIAKSMNLSDWYGIIIVSGDGLIYEVINGLMSRSDSSEAIKTPIGILPAGSGNALCTTLLVASKEPQTDNQISHATFMLLKHIVIPLDLMSVDVSGGRRIFSFLHVAWGLVSDVDIESEKFRRFGNARFTMGAVVRIANLRKYRGRLSFLPVDSNYRSKFITSSSRKFHHHTSTNQNFPNNNEEQHLSISNLTQAQQRSTNSTIAAEENNVSDSENNSNVNLAPLNQRINGQAGDGATDSEFPVRRFLPPSLDDPLPDTEGWITIEDDFVSLVASLQTHAAQDFVVAPDARVNDGCIHLLTARHGLSRLNMVKMLSEMEKGKMDNSEWVELVTVKAFRLIPLTSGKVLTVDGERVEYGPIQAEVLPSIARVMSHKLD